MKIRAKNFVSSERREFVYSAIILVAIPVLIIGNTLWLSRSVRSQFEYEFSQRTDLASKTLSAGVAGSLDEPDLLKERIVAVLADEATEENPEILTLAVLGPDTTDYQIIAANSDITFDDEITKTQISFVESKKRTIVFEHESSETANIWRSVAPILEDGEVIGFTVLDLSSATSDALIYQILTRSLYLMLGSVLIIMVLLFNHFRFVEYAMLFKKLEEVDKMKNDFLSVATHELKSPMTVIRGTIENILEGIAGQVDETAAENLRVVEHETERLTHLVMDLLSVSRIEQGRISYDMQEVSVNSVVSAVVSRYKDKAHKKNLQLEYIPKEEYKIKVDEGRLMEIMTNLIDNAIKYSKKGTVTITHKIEKNRLRTTVKDTGIGMTAKEREHLFERFYRIQNEKTTSVGGTGLGLWIIKQYVESMGGNIYVDSLEDVGSEFTVEFDLVS